MANSKLKIKTVLFPKTYSNGTQPVFIRVSQNRRCAYISTGISIKPQAWNDSEDLVWEKKPAISASQKELLSKDDLKKLKEHYASIIVLPDADKTNSTIKQKVGEVEKLKQKIEANDETTTPENFKKRLEKTDSESLYSANFMDFIKKVSADKYKARQIRTSEKYMVLWRKLNTFLKEKPLPIDKLTTSFIKEFEMYLRKENCHPNYINTNMRALRTIVKKEAIRVEKILKPASDPFFDYSMISVIPTKKERLDANEVLLIEELKLTPDDKLWNYRNAWLFSLYLAGIRVGDLMQLRWINITNDGRLEYTMGKTGKLRSFKLFPQALGILKKLRKGGVKETDFIFPFLDNNAEYAKLITHEDRIKADPDLLAHMFKKIESQISQYNAGLKTLATKCKIKKKLCSHMARHSFADMARKKGISAFDISRTLGHSSVKITETYLDSLALDVVDATVEKVFEKPSSK